jgi:hypothetical protein
MQNVLLVLSFDHELSLGGADSYQYNLFEPTSALIRLAAELEVPIVLFTDVLCAARYRDWDRDGFYEPYHKQLLDASRRGHDVQLHIHPHWVDSTWVDGAYRPSTSFALSDFGDAAPPNDIGGIVDLAYDLLCELMEPDAGYRCIAYRAGGNNLHPRTHDILSALYDKGIRIDSSIIKGFRFKSGISTVDFSAMPAPANWTIPLSGPLNAQAEEGIYEVPIAGRPRTPLNNVPFLVNRVLRRQRAHDPKGRSIHSDHTPPLQKIARLFPMSAWPLSFDEAVLSVDDALQTLRYHVASHPADETIVCAAVSHPKCLGSYELSLMRDFVVRARAEFGSALSFVTYRDVYDRIVAPNATRRAAPEGSSAAKDPAAPSPPLRA